MPYRWDKLEVPHKGWRFIEVDDVEDNYETCMMCNHERIRYVHILEHDEVPYLFRVGCVCAENMTEDYLNPRAVEKEVKKLANQKKNWLKRKWNILPTGSIKYWFEDYELFIFRDKKTQKFKCKINDVFGKKYYDTIDQAKMATYLGVLYFKNKQGK